MLKGNKSMKNLIGLNFNYLTVIERCLDETHQHNKKRVTWKTRCRCGKITCVSSSNLTTGKTKSCGCYKSEIISKRSRQDVTNQKFGRLIVIEFSHIKNQRTYWLCECSCGNKIIASISDLKSGHTQSCGCLQKERASQSSRIDLAGSIFGFLIVLDFHKRTNNETLWRCVCECGKEVFASSSNLKTGKIVSCGCKKESLIASKVKSYFLENYNSISEYPILRNSKTNKAMPFDVYIPFGKDKKVNGFYIEVHGEQHYKLCNWHYRQAKRNQTSPEEEFEYQKHKDKIKKKFAKKNGYYIEVNLLKIKTVDDAIDYIEKQIEKIIGEK